MSLIFGDVETLLRGAEVGLQRFEWAAVLADIAVELL